MGLVLDCRLAGRYCYTPQRRYHLLKMADELQTAINDFARTQTTESMTALNAAWVRATIALDAVPPIGDPNPNGGRLRAPKPVERITATG